MTLNKAIKSGLIITLFVVLSAGLLYFCYLGFFTRFWQDDWCYNADFQRLGFLGTLKGYSYITTYSSNRFSLTLFSGFLYYLGIIGVQVLPAVVIIWFSGSVFWLITNIQKIYKREMSKFNTLLISLTFVFFTIYIAPDRFQNFYWRSAILPYTFPILFFILIMAIISSRILKTTSFSKSFNLLIVVISFLGTGFSETGGAFFFTGLTIIFLMTLRYKMTNPSTISDNLMRSIGLGLATSLVALIIMILSPANAPRQLIYSEPSTLSETIFFSIKYGFDFMINSIKSYPLPHLIFFSIIFAISFLTNNSKEPRQSLYSLAKKLLIIILISILLIIAIQAPSAYIEGSIPGDRALIIAQWIFLFSSGMIAWLTGEFLTKALNHQAYNLVIFVMLTISILYVIRASYLTYDYHQPRFEKIAAVWDERDEVIKSQKAAGVNVIHVRAIDSQYLGGWVLEWTPEPNWVNNCAADFYQVQEIRATLDW